MKTKKLHKAHILFQGVLHLVLAAVQIAGFAGLSQFMANENSTFYVALAAWSMGAGVVICVTGVVLACLLGRAGQAEKTILIVLQISGAFLSVYLYRDYLYKISNPDLYSPAKWMLTPYLAALIVGAGLALLYKLGRKRHRA